MRRKPVWQRKIRVHRRAIILRRRSLIPIPIPPTKSPSLRIPRGEPDGSLGIPVISVPTQISTRDHWRQWYGQVLTIRKPPGTRQTTVNSRRSPCRAKQSPAQSASCRLRRVIRVAAAAAGQMTDYSLSLSLSLASHALSVFLSFKSVPSHVAGLFLPTSYPSVHHNITSGLSPACMHCSRNYRVWGGRASACDTFTNIVRSLENRLYQSQNNFL